MATVLPGVLSGYSVKALVGNSLLHSAFLPALDTDHVLVIIQLTGGNDGLNTVIPVSNYSNYYNARNNIAIPENRVLQLNGVQGTGLHPSMTGMQALYNEGKMALVQAVGYPSPSFSHFRATDIWMSGADSNMVLNTGWAGRYLNNEFPNFPNGYPTTEMPDPLAIQIGAVTTLTCQGPVVNMGMSITDPNSFYNLVNGVQDPTTNDPMGFELGYIRDIARQTNRYAQRIKNAATSVPQQVTYPSNNSLADQLKVVARLIKGGLKTRIYMVSYGSFDTHSLQVNSIDTTTGTHANLLGNVSNAIKAFMDDLKFLGADDRVIGITYSEFGRRIKSNASGGTDHGAAAPMFLFGKNIVGGVTGANPTLPSNATVNDNIPFQYDFRSVYASVLQQWFCVNQTDLQAIILNNYQTLNLAKSNGCTTGVQNGGDNLVYNYPNPFTQKTTISFTTKGGHTLIQIIDSLGQVLVNLVDRDYATAGTYTVHFDSGTLASGVYYVRLQNGPMQQVKSMLKVR